MGSWRRSGPGADRAYLLSRSAGNPTVHMESGTGTPPGQAGLGHL